MWPIENNKLDKTVKPQNTLKINHYSLKYSKKRNRTNKTLLQIKLQFKQFKLKNNRNQVKFIKH